MENPRLNPTVSVVRISDAVLEFFKTNIRKQVRIRVEDDTVLKIATSLDGTRGIDQLCEEFNVSRESLDRLLSFMGERGLLDNTVPHADFDGYDRFRRVIHFLAEYSRSHEHLMKMWDNIRESSVLIVGMGAVGTWVACSLAQSGVGTVMLMDGDVVEVSNIHRQFGFRDSDVGRRKVDVVAERLLEYNPGIRVVRVPEEMRDGSLSRFDEECLDLIVNCADSPNVDTTSLWVGEYAMGKGIPHIVGGGYNLHLSLVGQTVIPGRSACVRCFQKSLNEQNTVDATRVKKLAVKNKKVGSFGPMCSLIASMVGMEAVKILSGDIEPANVNRRGEFDIFTMGITYRSFDRRADCEWCGTNGKYFHM